MGKRHLAAFHVLPKRLEAASPQMSFAMIFASNSDSQHSTAEFRIKHPITYFIALRHREKVYYVPNRVFFELEKPTTFPGKVLVCGEYLYLNVSAYVTNLFLIQSGII